MPIITLKVLASVLQLHGPGATIQSDHQGIGALLSDLRAQNSEEVTQVYFRRGGFIRGGRGRRVSQRRVYPRVLGLPRNLLVRTRYRHAG